MIEIEIEKTYKLSLNEGQLRQLYNLLLRQKNNGSLNYDRELIPVLAELRKVFSGADEPESNEDNLPYFVGN
jgi:hypothetical protein